MLSRLFIVALVTGSMAGCSWLGWDTPEPTAPVEATTEPAGPPGRVPDLRQLRDLPLQAHVFRLTLPLGAFSLNDKLWRQLDEDALDSRTSVLLARNGLRAGVGPRARWGAVRELIDVPGASHEEMLCQTDGHSVLTLKTRSNIAEQTLWTVDADNRQQGRTYANCDNALRMAMSRIRESSDVLMQLEPVVQAGVIAVTRAPNDMGITRMTLPQEEAFADVRLAVRLKAGEFLVLSPADPKGREGNVGTCFLSEGNRVPATETVLIFVPATDK